MLLQAGVNIPTQTEGRKQLRGWRGQIDYIDVRGREREWNNQNVRVREVLGVPSVESPRLRIVEGSVAGHKEV